MWTNWNVMDQMFNAINLLQNRLNRLDDDYGRYRKIPAVWDANRSGPLTNLYDADDHLEMKLEIPGISKEELGIKVQGNYLEISGVRKSDAPEGYSAHRVERNVQSFTRSFTLPSDIDSDNIEAHLKNGLLILRLPKQETAKTKQITIH